jgi:hypothetical protein
MLFTMKNTGSGHAKNSNCGATMAIAFYISGTAAYPATSSTAIPHDLYHGFDTAHFGCSFFHKASHSR